MPASIIINQSGKPPGSPSQSRDDLDLSIQVTLTNSTAEGSYLWELLSRPVGSTAILSGTTLPIASFTPDVRGSYRVKLTTNGTEVDTRVAAVKTANLGIRKPATGEELEFDSVNGWGAAQQSMIDILDAQSAAYIKRNGTAGPTADIDWQGRKITNLSVTRLAMQSSDPGVIANSGSVYTKNDSGDTELFYRDAAGNVVQITKDGSMTGSTTKVSSADTTPDFLSGKLAAGFGISLGIQNPSGDETLSISFDGYSLDQSYDDGGSGQGRVIVVDSGAVRFEASGGNSLDVDGYITLREASDPTAIGNGGMLYAKDDSGDTELFYRDAGGNIVQITKDGALDAAITGGNTLDQAYDQGGAGAGRQIVANAGPVEIDAGDGAAIRLDGYLIMREIPDPSNLSGKGLLYVGEGVAVGQEELFYQDAAGNIVQITDDGYLATYDSVPGVGLFEQSADPSTIPGKGYIYSKDDSGDTELFYKDAAGNVVQITQDGSVVAAGSGSNTLDQAYDQGGSGAGRAILVDSGAVNLDADGGTALDIDGYVTMREISDPSALPNSGMVYTKDDSGDTELCYRDAAGNVVQITKDGTLNSVAAGGNTLDQAYDQGGVGAGRVIDIDSGPIVLDAVGDAVLEADGYIILDDVVSDPSALSGSGELYTKDDSGDIELFYRDDSGNVVQITQDGYLAATESGGNTLDQAYDQGGSGVGRVVLVDSGPVVLDASGDAALETDGYVILDDIGSDPSALVGSGELYVKDDSGDIELFYCDADGNIVQITQDGYVATTGGTSVYEAAVWDVINLTDGVPSSDIIINSSSDKLVMPESGSLSFNTTVSGLYSVIFSGELIAATANSSAQFKLVFDEGESNEQSVGYNEKWQTNPTIGNYTEPVFRDVVTLSAGVHTVKAYGKRVDGSGAIQINADFIHPPQLTLQNVSGYGIGTIKVSPNDAQDGYLVDKLEAGLNIVLSQLNDGADESMGIATSEIIKLPEQSSDPTASILDGYIYTKGISDITELFYMDDSGNVVQITQDGYLANIGGTGSQQDTVYFSNLYANKSWETGSNFTTGLRLGFIRVGTMRGVRFWHHDSSTITYRAKLWHSTTQLAVGTVSTSSGQGWYEIEFDTPYDIDESMVGDVDYYISLYDTTNPGYYSSGTGDPPFGQLRKIGVAWAAYDGIPHHYRNGDDSTSPTSTASVGRYPIDPLYDYDL